MLDCSEEKYSAVAQEILKRANGRSCVLLLEGEMGAGKSTFARAVLRELGVSDEAFQGSPTFSITHTYDSQVGRGRVITHTDLYRIQDEGELELSGIEESLWSTDNIFALLEWGSMWPVFTSQIHSKLSQSKWVLEIRLEESSSGGRNLLLREIV